MSLEIKSCVLDFWDFFLKLYGGCQLSLSKKNQRNKCPEENKSEEKKNLEKSPKSQEI